MTFYSFRKNSVFKYTSKAQASCWLFTTGITRFLSTLLNVFVLTMVCNIFTNRFYFSYSSFRSASSFPLSAFQKLLVFCVVLVYVYPVMRGEFLLSWKLLLLCRSKCGFPFRYSVNVYVLRWPCRLNPGCLGGPGNYYFRLCTSSRGALFVVFLITWSCLIFFVAQ